MMLYFFHRLILSPRAGSLIRRIALLSIFGIGLSVAAYLIVLSVMTGMNLSLRDKIISIEPHLVFTFANLKDPSLAGIHPLVKRLEADSNLRFQQFEVQDIVVRTLDGQFRFAIGKGVSKDSLSDLLLEVQKTESQRTKMKIDYDPTHDFPGPGEVIMGIDLARALNLLEGDEITLLSPDSLMLPMGEIPRSEKVRIKKILTTNLADLDSQYLFYQNGRSLLAIDAQSRQFGIEAWIKGDPLSANSVKERFVNFQDIKVESWMDRNSSLFFALKGEKWIIGLFLAIAGLIATSSILTVLLLLVSQKKRDIAILQTMGLSRQRSVGIFTGMGCLLASIGIGGGLVIGLSVSLYIEYFPVNILPSIYYDSTIPASVQSWMIVSSIGGAAVVALLGSWLPSRTILQMQPSSILRRQ